MYGARRCHAEVTTVTSRTPPSASTIGSEHAAFPAVLRPATSSSAGTPGRRHAARICSASDSPPVEVYPVSTTARVRRRWATHSARWTRPSDSREMRCSWLKAGIAVAEHHEDVIPAGGATQHLGRGCVADQGETRMRAQQRGREAGAGRREEHRPQRLGLARTRDEHQQFAGGQQRAQADRERVGGDVLDAAELLGRIRARLRMEGDDACAALQAGARLVEGDVSVVPEPQDGEVDGRLVEPPLVAITLGGRIRSRPVETVERPERDTGELALQVRGEAALIT